MKHNKYLKQLEIKFWDLFIFKVSQVNIVRSTCQLTYRFVNGAKASSVIMTTGVTAAIGIFFGIGFFLLFQNLK